MCADPMRPRAQILVVAMLFLAAAALSQFQSANTMPWLLYNASGSAPIGFYRIENRTPEREETAVVLPSATLENLLSSHRLLPPGVPLLKRVVARGGDRICRSDGVIFVNGKAPPRRLITMPKAVPCRHGMGVSLSSPASSSSCNHILIRSTAVISARSANAKSSASRTLCGRGIQANRDAGSPPQQQDTIGRMSKQRRGRGGGRDKSCADFHRRSRCLHI